MKQDIQEINVKMGKVLKKLLIFGGIIFCQCESLYMDRVYPIKLVNNKDYSIGCYFSLGGKYGTYYPDTLIPIRQDYVILDVISKEYTYDSKIEWREIFKELPQDTLSIFIFHTDTLNKYSWEEVRNGYKILKRYDLSLQDIERLNYNVPYPPSPEMAKMKMYPKYP